MPLVPRRGNCNYREEEEGEKEEEKREKREEGGKRDFNFCSLFVSIRLPDRLMSL